MKLLLGQSQISGHCGNSVTVNPLSSIPRDEPFGPARSDTAPKVQPAVAANKGAMVRSHPQDRGARVRTCDKS